jgi:two-component system, NtrC family, sensor kinase
LRRIWSRQRPNPDLAVQKSPEAAQDAIMTLQRDLDEARRQQIATSGVLKVISGSIFDLQVVLDTLIKSAVELCDADCASIFQREGEFYRCVSSFGFSAEYIAYGDAHPLKADGNSIAGRVAVEKRPVQVLDVATADANYAAREYQRLGGHRTVFGVPMLRNGEPIGALNLGRFTVRAFAERQIELVQTFADQAVIAIENARLFREVEARTRDLANSLQELRSAQDRLIHTEKLASLGQLTAGIAHEIKNPLNFVNNFSALSLELVDELREALGSATLDVKIRAEVDELAGMLTGNLAKIVQHGERADSIVRNMLLHSRTGSGERRTVDVNALVDESLNLAYHGARAEKPGFNAKLARDLDPAAGRADLYPQEVTRVLLNLVSNGFYAATERHAAGAEAGYEPTITVATRDCGAHVEIRVRDNGTGIPDHIKAKIFDPFFTTKPAGEGTGLGLSLSHDIIVKQHGGTIEVATEPGRFTEFTITLPRDGSLS